MCISTQFTSIDGKLISVQKATSRGSSGRTWTDIGFVGPSSKPSSKPKPSSRSTRRAAAFELPKTDDEFLPVVYVGSLPPNCDEDMLMTHFAKHVTPLSANVCSDFNNY